MADFFFVLMIILVPLFFIALAVGRRAESEEQRSDRDQAIREGVKALKERIKNLETLRQARREKRR
jgi:hypothetical protein